MIVLSKFDPSTNGIIKTWSLWKVENHSPFLPSAESEYAFLIRSPKGSSAQSSWRSTALNTSFPIGSQELTTAGPLPTEFPLLLNQLITKVTNLLDLFGPWIWQAHEFPEPHSVVFQKKGVVLQPACWKCHTTLGSWWDLYCRGFKRGREGYNCPKIAIVDLEREKSRSDV